MIRRHFLQAALAAAATAGSSVRALGASGPSIGGAIPAGHPLQDSWTAWKAICLTSEGRIVDGFQNSDSHSEGQGYGLTLAVAFGDRPAYEAIRDWTVNNLSARPDSLFAWRWKHDTSPHIADRNNASDGDLFFAWALTAGAALWNQPDDLARATRMARDLARLCITGSPTGNRLIFKPAAVGFDITGGVVVNPSYYMPRAMRDVAAATGVSEFTRCASDGQSLLAEIAQAGLVPDWIQITPSGWGPAPGRFSNNAGYEAIRVPLFAAWSGNADAPQARRFAEAAAKADTGSQSAVVLDTAGNVVETSASAGYRAVAMLVDCTQSHEYGSTMPAFARDQPYYPATLHLMALIAQTEFYPRCVPI